MKLTSRQDIEAPIGFVYAQMTDFDQFERMALRRGAEVEHRDTGAGPGTRWILRFAYKKKPRKLEVKLLEAVQDTSLDYGLDSAPMEGQARFELLALSPKRTRLTMVVDVKPKTLPARLLIQSLRLAKGRVQRKFDASAAKLADVLRENWKAQG